MRSKLIIAILLLLSSSVFAQRPTGVPQLFGGRYYQFSGYVRVDSALMFPARDTTVQLILPGIVYRSADSSFYFWNMQKWAKISSGATSGGGGGSDPLKLNISDTASMLSKYLRITAAAATYQPIGSYATTSSLALKFNISDTASMLSGYQRQGLIGLPAGGSTGQSLFRTGSGYEWATTSYPPIAISDVTGLTAALDAKQATLVSGTNIKTINGNSILGSGDLVISGGGGIQPSDTAAMLSGYQRLGLIGLPTGGSTGQGLFRTGSGYEWATPSYPPTTVADVTGLQDSLNGVRNAATLGAFAINLTTTISSGTSSTVSNQIYRIDFDPATLIASYTLTLPASPSDGQRVIIRAGRQIAAGAVVVTSFTVSPNSGQTLYAAITPTQLNGGDVMEFEYETSTTTWTRIR